MSETMGPAGQSGQPDQESSLEGESVTSSGTTMAEDTMTKYGYNIVIAGLTLVTVLYIFTIITFAILTPKDIASNVVSSMGAITGVIGSLVAAYFGIQSGAAGKEASDANAVQQSALAAAAMGQWDPNNSAAAIRQAQQILQTRR